MDDPAQMHAFRPIQVGTMHLDHRLVVSPHRGGGRVGESDELFERHCAYWLARVKGGVQWVGGEPLTETIPSRMYVERMGEYFTRLHAANGFGTAQLVLPSAHTALDTDEADRLTHDHVDAAAIAMEAGADAIELLCDQGPLLTAIVKGLRSRIGRQITIGVRLGLGEMLERGMQIADVRQLVADVSATGAVDYFCIDVGGDVDPASTVPAGGHDEIAQPELCGQVKRATHLPVVYVGRVFDIATAERVLAAGHADLVAVTRAAIADPDIVARTRRGEGGLVRPCVGVNDCADRRSIDGLRFVCAANPHAGNEHIGRLAPVKRSQRVLVIGGGPAGIEFAALAKQRGHRVTLWERDAVLGGQLAVAAKARVNARFAEWIRWQQARLQRLAVTVELGHEATLEDVEVLDPNVVVVATGSVPRPIDVPGDDLPFVHQATDVLNGGVDLGHHVVVVAEGDSAAPLAVADHLSGLGHRVTVTYRATGPSVQFDTFAISASLARLDSDGARFEPMARVVGIERGQVHLAHSFSDRRWAIDGVDSVVLACGTVADNELYLSLRTTRSDVHLLGDPSAPPRLVSATRQAWELAQSV